MTQEQNHPMQENERKTPSNESDSKQSNHDIDNKYFVVSRFKLAMMFIATLGLYAVYWFYKHFALIKEKTHRDIWPIPRGIFSIFFTHSLFNEIEHDRKKANIEGNADWSPNGLATFFVVATIASNLASRLMPEDNMQVAFYFVVFLLVVMILSVFPLLKAQEIANQLMKDPAGLYNNDITGLNVLWITIGGVFWIGMIAILLTGLQLLITG